MFHRVTYSEFFTSVYGQGETENAYSLRIRSYWQHPATHISKNRPISQTSSHNIYNEVFSDQHLCENGVIFDVSPTVVASIIRGLMWRVTRLPVGHHVKLWGSELVFELWWYMYFLVGTFRRNTVSSFSWLETITDVFVVLEAVRSVSAKGSIKFPTRPKRTPFSHTC